VPLEAILTITTNSVPVLVQRLSADTSAESRLEAKWPTFLRTKTIMTEVLYRRRYRAACAVRALRLSGTNAASAVPAVAQLLSSTNPQPVQVNAILILSAIGPAAVPAIRQAMKDPDPSVRGLGVFGVGQLGTNAGPAIPDLVAALSDPNNSVSNAATNVLRALARLGLTNAPAH
jgi:HEAT repeat protein